MKNILILGLCFFYDDEKNMQRRKVFLFALKLSLRFEFFLESFSEKAF